MKKIFNRLWSIIKNDAILKGFSVLFSGTVVTQIVSIVLSPILTRLYSPELYGVNSVYISYLTIAGVIATLRLQVPIAISPDAIERKTLSHLGFFTTAVASLVAQIVLLAFDDIRVFMFGNNYESLKYLFPLSILLLGSYEMLYQNLLSLKMYRVMTVVTFIKVLGQGLSQILLSFTSFSEIGLILGNILSFILSLLVMGYMLKIDFKILSYINYKTIFLKNLDYPKFAFPAELASMTAYSIVPIILSALYSPEISGYYSLANKLIGIPVGLFGNSMRQVFMGEASLEFNNNNTFSKTFNKVSKLLSLIALPIGVLLLFISPFLVNVIFGSEWYQSGVYIQAMILFFLARFIVGPITSAVNIIGKQKIGLYVHAILLGCILIISIVSYFVIKVEPVVFLAAYSALYAIVYFAYFYYIYKMSRKK